MNPNNMQNNGNMTAYIKRVQNWFRAFGMKSYLTLFAIRNSERDVKLTITPIGKEGTSYTNGKDITVTLWKEFWTKSFAVIKTAMEAFTAHEAEHVRSSNFDDGKRAAEEVGRFYNKKYGIDEMIGRNLGHSLYNIIEDGRIERIAVNRFPGLARGLKLVNAVLYEKNTLDVENSSSMYKDFMAGILTIAKTGLKPKNWDVLYKNQEADAVLNDIAYIIYDATCQDYTEDVVKAVIEVNKIIDPFIHEALEKDNELQKQLEQMAADASQAQNDAATQASQAGSNGSGGQSLNTPQGIPNNGNGNGGGSSQANGQSQGQGSGVGNKGGASNAQEAADTAQEKQMSADDLEKEIDDDEYIQEEIDNRIKENEEAEKQNSDDQVTKDELNKLGESDGLDYGDSKIEHFQQALEEDAAYEVTNQINEDGNKIYNSLKRLFMEKNDILLHKQKRGKLDASRFHSLVAMKNAGQIEDKIFYKVKKAVQASCAAYLVVDTSGSTGGRIFDNELDACAKIELGFGKLIPLKIAAYDSDWNFRFRIIRDFENKRTATNLSYNFKKMQSAGGGTPTAEAMALAGYELLKRKEKNKLLIVVTDGCPDNNEKVRREVHKLRKKGIKVVAILISDDTGNNLVKAFDEMYEGRDVITERSENIAPYLIKLLTRWITSSMYK